MDSHADHPGFAAMGVVGCSRHHLELRLRHGTQSPGLAGGSDGFGFSLGLRRKAKALPREQLACESPGGSAP